MARKCISNRRALTLLELLVVIAIIAVLIVILLPVLRKARPTAEADGHLSVHVRHDMTDSRRCVQLVKCTEA